MTAPIDNPAIAGPVATTFDMMVAVILGASLGTCLALLVPPAIAFVVSFLAALLTPPK